MKADAIPADILVLLRVLLTLGCLLAAGGLSMLTWKAYVQLSMTERDLAIAAGIAHRRGYFASECWFASKVQSNNLVDDCIEAIR